MPVGREMLEKSIESTAEQLHAIMDELLPEPSGLIEDQLFKALRYVALSPGKRIRPYLVVATSSAFGVSLDCALKTAVAIEFIHAYSLVHDDLPAMDNDDFRRGQPSCHKKFDEATAILTGDALLTLAFEMLAHESTHPDPGVRTELISKIAVASGYRGMVGGQMMDLLAQHNTLEFSEVVRLQRMKTGALFAISCEAGAILGKASKNLRNALRAYANNIGIAFQITDDLLDAEGTREKTGKSVGKDKSQGKATLVSCIGIEKAREHALVLAKQAIEHLNIFDGKANLLKELAYFIVERNK
ncbi:polyprenyl synthetase family protein [Holosporaceae bacterium 'Namur']|nr:polyprenyl synthetase family protein [Holosporaceae bacterium 'Namur']